MKNQTIGERIDELTKQYKELYDRLRNDDQFVSGAKNLALSDLSMKRYIYTEAERNVERYIACFETD